MRERSHRGRAYRLGVQLLFAAVGAVVGSFFGAWLQGALLGLVIGFVYTMSITYR